MIPKLSIGIPTYNRKKQLQNQLKSIFKQDLSNIHEIIIVDNHSDYNVQELIDEFDSELIRLVINPFNIKMASNMMSPFLYCKSDWLWLLSDDDETLKDSIENIWSKINDSPLNTGMIKFSLDKEGCPQREINVDNLGDYIDYYYNEPIIRRGELVFISTNVYNVKNIHSYLNYGFEYNYTYIGFLIPVFKALEDKAVIVSFSSKAIVKYIAPRGDGYSFGTVGKGLSTLSHLPIILNKENRKKFLNITMSILPKSLMLNCLNNIDNLKDFKIIYNNIYRYYIPFTSKLILKSFFFLMSVKPLKEVTNKCLQVIRNLK